MIQHIIERELIHFFSGGSVYLLAYFTYQWAKRKWPEWTDRILPALLAALVIFLREPADVAAGGWVGKSYIDFTFWMLGLGVAIYGLMRYKK